MPEPLHPHGRVVHVRIFGNAGVFGDAARTRGEVGVHFPVGYAGKITAYEAESVC